MTKLQNILPFLFPDYDLNLSIYKPVEISYVTVGF